MAQKVNLYSRKKSPGEASGRHVPKPRLSLLPETSLETVKGYLERFEKGKDANNHYPESYRATEDEYDPRWDVEEEEEEEEEEEGYTLYQSGHRNKSFDKNTSIDREDSFDDMTLSMI